MARDVDHCGKAAWPGVQITVAKLARVVDHCGKAGKGCRSHVVKLEMAVDYCGKEVARAVY